MCHNSINIFEYSWIFVSIWSSQFLNFGVIHGSFGDIFKMFNTISSIFVLFLLSCVKFVNFYIYSIFRVIIESYLSCSPLALAYPSILLKYLQRPIQPQSQQCRSVPILHLIAFSLSSTWFLWFFGVANPYSVLRRSII